MDIYLIILILAILIGFYSAVNIGANDVANAMATSVASGALTIKKAVFVAAVCDILGAVLVGSYVANTIRKGLVDPLQFSDRHNLFIFGMLAAVLGSALWVNLATFFKLPVSTTHSIIGGVLGFGLVSVGFAGIKWKVVLYVIMSWVISPVFGGVIAFIIFSIIKKSILSSPEPIEQTKKIGPFLAGIVGFILSLAIIFKGLKNLHLDLPFLEALLISLGVGMGSYFLGSFLLRRYKVRDMDPYYQVEKMANPLQVLSACYQAFSHGANDVANAIGPVAAIWAIIETQQVEMSVSIPLWLLLVGGAGLAFGVYTWGHRVMETVGKKITAITPTRGFSAEFGTATTVLLCSRLGMPVSTTHVAIGNIIGVGLARGISAINLDVIKRIFSAWIISLPAAGLFSVAIYFILTFLFA
ncbi:MAG: inorganic phosphate transporter [Candidatus Aminicenantes bacterium]|nr:MAG: inorganic phosphate transporter [Candidatus Aminicenantes bacterium]